MKGKIIFFSALCIFIIMTNIFYSINENISVNLESNEIIMTKEIHFEKIINLKKDKIFELLTDVDKYSVILPKYIQESTIINQTDNIIYSKERIGIEYLNIETHAIHKIEPNEIQQIEIVEGDAKGTTIKMKFDEEGDKTRIISDVKLNFRGAIAIFASVLHEGNIISAMNTVLTEFETFGLMHKT